MLSLRLSRSPASLPGLLLAATVTLGAAPMASAITRTWDGGAGTLSWHDANNWDPDGVPQPADDVIIDVPASTITVTHSTGTNTINSLTCEENLTLTGGTLVLATTATMHGAATLNGGTLQGGTWDVTAGSLSATANSSNRLTGVTVNGDLTLSASGAKVRIEGGTTFTTAHLSGFNSAMGFAPGQTLTGAILFEGTAGGSRFVEMNGTAGAFTIGPTGVIRTESGFTDSGFIGSGSIYGGAMTLVNDGLISSQVSGRTITVPSISFTNNLSAEATGGGVLVINSTTWSNAGDITGTNSTLTFSGSWSNPGTMTLNGGTLNFGGTFTTAGIGTFVNNAGTVNLTGTLNNAASTLLLDGGTGSWNLSGGTISGGQLDFARGATLNITNNSSNRLTGVTVNGDLTLSASGAKVRIEGGTTFTTAHLSGFNSAMGFAPGQTLTGAILFEGTAGGSRFVEMNGTAGAFTIGPTGVIRTESGFTDSGFIGSGSIYGGAMTLVNDGLISSQVSGRTITVPSISFTNNLSAEATGGGILNVNSPNWSNAGTLNASGGNMTLSGTSTNTGTVNIAATRTVTISSGTLSNSGSGIVTGEGTLVASGTTLSNAATFSPGASPGIFTVTGNYPETPTATLDIQLGGLAPGTQHDRLVVSGTATLSGTLRLTFVDGFTPHHGDTFTVLTAGTRSGTFSTVDVVGYPDCVASVQYTATTAVVQIESVVPAAICQNIDVDLDESGNASILAAQIDNGSSDDCGIDSIEIEPSGFTCSDVGANSVTLTVTDLAGNVGTCEATVTVHDVTPPAVTCQDITLSLDESGSAGLTPAQVFASGLDNCGTVNLVSVVPDTFSCANLGPNLVTLTVNDGNGNEATCQATVTVEDVTPRELTCQDITISLDEFGNAAIVPSQVLASGFDACGTVNLISVVPNTFTCANLGPNTVTLTATDGNGNEGTCEATVTVEDTTPPEVSCQKFEVALSTLGQASITPADVFATGTDNCGTVDLVSVSGLVHLRRRRCEHGHTDRQ